MSEPGTEPRRAGRGEEEEEEERGSRVGKYREGREDFTHLHPPNNPTG